MKTAEPQFAEIDRQLTERDLAECRGQKVATKAPHIKKIRQRHHLLARSLASGMADFEICAACDVTPSRLSILKNDPLFADLVRVYQEKAQEQFIEFQGRLAEVATDAVELLGDRMEEAPDTFDNRELMDIVKMGADRTGHGPSSSTNHNHHHDIGARLDAARKRLAPKPPDADDAEIIPDG